MSTPRHGGNGTGSDRSESERPSTAVVFELAAETGAAVTDLRPLADSVDPEALDALFALRSADDATVTFTHEGCTVTVTGTADVQVECPAGE